MPVPFTQSQLQSVSSHVTKKLLRAENMDTFTTELGDSWIDPLDPRILNILETLSGDLELYTYVAGKSITTVSYELYGTTSAWWIILYVNGYMHPDEISDGALLKVPTGNAMAILLQETGKNNRGKEVRI